MHYLNRNRNGNRLSEKPNEKQERNVHKTLKQSTRQNIKKSLLSVKGLFHRQVVPKNKPTIETCTINGKWFPVYNRKKGFKIAAVNFNVWEIIGKPQYSEQNGFHGFRFILDPSIENLF